MAEIIDIVDEEDNVKGQMERDEAHDRSFIHRAAHVFIFNSKGELLLQKRSMKKRQYAGFWGDVAGHMDAGESYEAAAARELKEEVGIKAKLEFLMKFRKSYPQDQEFVVVYRAVHEGPFKADPEEVEFVKFFPLSRIAEMLKRGESFTPGAKLALEEYLRKHGN
jgi:isopentenyl-diphosphate delta-isomerase type 1